MIGIRAKQVFVGKNGKVSWTAKLVAHPRVRHITAEELVAGLATPDGDARAPGKGHVPAYDASEPRLGAKLTCLGTRGPTEMSNT
jgi:hypothetical protein